MREGAKLQRRGSVEKLTDTLENVARKSLSLPSLKSFSGPPRLRSPSPSPGLPQSLAQQQPQRQEYRRFRSQPCSRPATLRTPSYPSHPASSPLTSTRSSNSTHSLKLGIVQEFGHPSRHPASPVHIDDGEDREFASFLVPVD